MNSYSILADLKSPSYLNLAGTEHDTYLRQLLEDASRVIDNECRRHFYVWEGIRYEDGAEGRVLCLSDDLLSLSSLYADEDGDGTFEASFDPSDYILYPLNGYPKDRVKLSMDSHYGYFAIGIRQGIKLTGTWGFGDGESATPYRSSGGTGTIANETLTSLTLSVADLVIAGQTIKIALEQMYIESVASTIAIVRRGVNGTLGIAHTEAAIYIYQYPMPIVESCLIIAMRAWKRKDSAFMDIVGNPETGQIPIVKGLDPDVSQRLRRGRYVRYLGGFA